MTKPLTITSLYTDERTLTVRERTHLRHQADFVIKETWENGSTRYGISLSPDDARRLAGWINEAFPLPKNAREVIETLPVDTRFRLKSGSLTRYYRKVTENTVQEYANDTFDTPVDRGQWFLDTSPWLFTGWPVDEVTVYEPRTTTIYVPKEG